MNIEQQIELKKAKAQAMREFLQTVGAAYIDQVCDPTFAAKLQELALQELIKQAQELDMGYGPDSGNTKPAP